MAWFTTDWSSSHHTVRCAHKSGYVTNFIIVACSISSRLKWCKNYKNRLRLAKVIVKNVTFFYGSLCIVKYRKKLTKVCNAWQNILREVRIRCNYWLVRWDSNVCFIYTKTFRFRRMWMLEYIRLSYTNYSTYIWNWQISIYLSAAVDCT